MHKTVLITGGAGYVGSHISWWLAKHGYIPLIIDNFSHRQTQHAPWAITIQADFAHVPTLEQICSNHTIDTVIHCAASIEVNTSLKDPKQYYQNNLFKTGVLLETMLAHGVKKYIFSSSCAVYGNPIEIPITEFHPCNPLTPYGKTKYFVEQMLIDYAHAYDLQFVSLRYFNAAGAEPDFYLGEQHIPETHIIPLLLQAILQQKPFMLFGNDYNTPDGSCIRDFLHVTDIAHAHLLALKHLEHNQPSDYFNLGTGQGISIKQLVKTAEQLFDTSIKLIITERRAGDPDRLVADASKAKHILNWQPQHSHIKHILHSAYSFMIKHQKQHELSPHLFKKELLS